ncbi:MAG: DUF1848 domain-containing protein [Proteobacteria bacterium]|nr:DUF1848 domain-containing protein [Pseudomonadota bacterium]
MGRKGFLVISASRRTDLVGCFPGVMVERLGEYPPQDVHSIVVWTKNPQNIVMEGELKKILKEYRQIYVHLTITGMGGGEFEPMIPPWKEVVRMIGPLTDLVGGPLRISWRFDPILKVERNGKVYSNFDLFPVLAEAIAPFGIKICRMSWVSPYKKVVTRLGQKGWRLIPQIHHERINQARQLAGFAQRHGMNIHFCSMERFPISRCIDGEFLSKIHPDGLTCSREKAKGQRELCGCTQSIDIGWYSLQCKHGCLYCYASP